MTETPEFAGMVCRMVTALGRRVGEGDPVDLVEFARVQAALDEALRGAVAAQRSCYSWSMIADGLGTTRQAAHARFAAHSGSTGGSAAVAG